MVYTVEDITFALDLFKKAKPTHPLLMHFVDRSPEQDVIQNIQDHFKFAENFTSRRKNACRS